MNIKKMMLTLSAAALALNLDAGQRELTYAVEDAAYQAMTKMGEDARMAKSIRRLAFVRLWKPDSAETYGLADVDVVTLEAALGSVPTSFDFVLHSNRDQQWTLIDEVFDQMSDMDDYNPSTHPKLNELQLCDGLLLVKLIGGEERNGVTTVRFAFKVIEVKTARQVWSSVVEGRYDGNAAPENEALAYFARKAVENAAADAVSKLPASLDGYGVLVLPLQGEGGRALTQVFLNAATAAGRQDKIRFYDLPNGDASSRMIGRYLWERTGSGKALDPSALKRVQDRIGVKGRLAVMTGMVTAGRVFPETVIDPTGRPVDLLTGSYTAVRGNPTSFEITADLKFRDVTDAFRVVAAVSANGVYKRNVLIDIWEQLRALATVRNIVVAVVVLLLIWFVGKFCFRVR